MRRADIYVHPGWHAERNVGLNNTCYVAYEAALQDAYGKSDLPILVHDTKKGPYPPLYEWDRLFDEGFKVPTKPSMGELAEPRDAQRIVRSLERFNIDHVFIHGSYLEICVDAFIASMEDGLGTSSVCYANDFEPAIWLLPDMSHLTASLGNVLSIYRSKEERTIVPFDLSETSRPYNPNLGERLAGHIDESTMVYHLSTTT